jgi:cysteine desulfurase/selenocysteine lyase
MTLKSQFPILSTKAHGRELVYLDSAATTQKPNAVLEAMQDFYAQECANVHRGVHYLSERATASYENARNTVRAFMGAANCDEIVFVRGVTEAMNLLASTFGEQRVGAGDEIIVSEAEHHSNIVPWQLLCERKGASLKVVPVTDSGELDMAAYEKLFTPRTRLVAIAHASNVLGAVNPLKDIIRIAHAHDVPVAIDGAQAPAHLSIDVTDLDCDFYAISAHKMYGPFGIGALYGKAKWLDMMPPYQGGGDMIHSVHFEKSTWALPPLRFEAGTPNVAAAIGFAKACEFMQSADVQAALRLEEDLMHYALSRLAELPFIRVIGQAKTRVPVISFEVLGAHPHDVASIVDRQGVAVRAGHLCAQPLMRRFGVPALTRASLGVYNTKADIDALVTQLMRVKELLLR